MPASAPQLCPATHLRAPSLTQRELETLEAEGLAAGIHSCGSSSARLAAAAKEAAVGWRVVVCCRADGMSYEGQVLAYKPATGLHHVLYLDGEDEWLSLVEEQTQWLEHHRGTIPAGLQPGECRPPPSTPRSSTRSPVNEVTMGSSKQ